MSAVERMKTTESVVEGLFKQRWAFALVGAGMIAAAAWFYIDTRSFLARAVRLDGVVIDMAERRHRDEGKVSYSWAPVVEFTNVRGDVLKFTASSASNPPKYAIGQRVSVLWAPDQEPSLDTFGDLWGAVIPLAGLGAAFLGVGTVLGAIRRRRMRAQRPGS